jgi:hypothetical protein
MNFKWYLDPRLEYIYMNIEFGNHHLTVILPRARVLGCVADSSRREKPILLAMCAHRQHWCACAAVTCVYELRVLHGSNKGNGIFIETFRQSMQ